jgi:hypothetical protein
MSDSAIAVDQRALLSILEKGVKMSCPEKLLP